VIRADDQEQFIRAVNRLDAILKREHGMPGAAESSGNARAPSQVGLPTLSEQFLVEQFVGGPEVALEGMLTRGELSVLAMFDKPDPLNGPFFEETIYGGCVMSLELILSRSRSAATAIGCGLPP
jgi:hypothetical protein